MNRIAIAIALLPSIGLAQDAAAILAKARTSFIENRKRERFWNWTTISTRSITDKNDVVLETLPSVTVESPIRSDGKRCNALLAWGDGVEPYLANASAEERCSVMTQTPNLFEMEAFLESRQVKIQSQTADTITLAIREDKKAMASSDPAQRCVASVRGTVLIDTATFFPKHIDVTMPSKACMNKLTEVENHYGDEPLKNISGGSTKGTFMRNEYQLQKDKSGDPAKDFWICVRRYGVRPLEKGANVLVVSGRRFALTSSGDRRIVVEGRTTATELAAESTVTFEKQQ